MPVFLRLVMDQRELPDLLTECANSKLPVEVKQLRVNAGKSSRDGAKASDKQATVKAEITYDVPVELLGVIYIYNKPPSEPAPRPAARRGAGRLSCRAEAAKRPRGAVGHRTVPARKTTP